MACCARTLPGASISYDLENAVKDSLGRVANILVLGGDSDIAAATVAAFAARKTGSAILAGRDTERLEARASVLRAKGMTVETVVFDGDDLDSHADFFDSVFAKAGRIDAVMIAFGVLGDQERGEREAATAVAVAKTNFLGAVSAAVNAGEKLRQQGQGTLIVLSSVAAQRPRRSNFVYGASKAGIDAFAEGLAFALKDQGVQVLTVRPGFVKTKMTSHMRNAPFATTPEAVGAAIVQAVAKGDELIWVPGKMRFVMMIMKLVPRPIFRRLKI